MFAMWGETQLSCCKVWPIQKNMNMFTHRKPVDKCDRDFDTRTKKSSNALDPRH